MKLRVAMIVTALALGIAWNGSGQLICQQDLDGVSRRGLASPGPGKPVVLASAPPRWAVKADGSGQPAPCVANGIVTRHDVPEPTTIIAGALLLLPFVASALRIARKRRKEIRH